MPEWLLEFLYVSYGREKMFFNFLFVKSKFQKKVFHQATLKKDCVSNNPTDCSHRALAVIFFHQAMHTQKVLSIVPIVHGVAAS